MMRWDRKSLFVLAAAALGVPAVHAHHSAAAYDTTKTLSLAGTLKEFDFSAPHVGVRVVYTNDKGEPTEMLVSTVAPAMILAQGFKPKDFRKGQKIELTFHPYRSGAVGGDLVSMKLEDGRLLQSGPPSGPPPAYK